MREVNTHKIIRIFLASSIDDTKEERDKLQNKILAVWNVHNILSFIQWLVNLSISSSTSRNWSCRSWRKDSISRF